MGPNELTRAMSEGRSMVSDFYFGMRAAEKDFYAAYAKARKDGWTP